jgi:hypothetical protein
MNEFLILCLLLHSFSPSCSGEPETKKNITKRSTTTTNLISNSLNFRRLNFLSENEISTILPLDSTYLWFYISLVCCDPTSPAFLRRRCILSVS